MARNETKKDIAKGTLRKEIRSYIQEQIASGRFKAGDRIVESAGDSACVDGFVRNGKALLQTIHKDIRER